MVGGQRDRPYRLVEVALGIGDRCHGRARVEAFVARQHDAYPIAVRNDRGSIVGTATEAAAAASRSSATLAKRLMACKLRMVGKISSNSPARWAAKARRGDIQVSAMVSPASWAAR